MAFRIGDIIDYKESGVLRGIQKPVACDCWFTSTGKTIPLRIKIMDSEGELHFISDIRVLSSEEKNYCGIKTIEHVCIIAFNNMEYTVKLIFTKEECRWTLVTV